jgi:ATP-dependent RNA helicase RhlE
LRVYTEGLPALRDALRNNIAMSLFSQLGLSEPLVRAVEASGYTTPTPIQTAAIPIALTGGDLIGCAQTGTGKTAAFVLPMLERLAATRSDRRTRPVRALVVTPTRELALQVEESVRTYGQFAGLRSVAVFGGVGMEPQTRAFHRGVDIVIATPGRLLDHLGRRNLDLSAVEVLVLDEADRMFDMGFINDVRKIVAAVPKKRQTLLFSATMPPAIQSLAASIQHKPQMVEIGARTNAAETVRQQFVSVASDLKLDLLIHVLAEEAIESVIVFSRTKHRADRITKKLNQQGIASVAIHSNRSQSQRQRALAGFKSGEFRVMVATDIAARGIDVDGVSHVINFDTPNIAEDYIHRIGRTGRAEATGDALTFFASDEAAYVKEIERVTGRKADRITVAGFGGRSLSGDGSSGSAPVVSPSSQANRGGGGRNHSSRGRRR